MDETYMVMVTLDGRDQFTRILGGESAAKAAAKRYAKDILTLQEKGYRGCFGRCSPQRSSTDYRSHMPDRT